MSRLVKWILGVGITIVVLACAGYWFAHERADAVIEEHRKRAVDGLAQLAGRFGRRAPLAAWPAGRPASEKPTDARPIYERVLTSLDAIAKVDFEILPEAREGIPDKIDERAVRAFVRSHQFVFDDLREILYADGMSADPRVAEGIEHLHRQFERWFRLHTFLEGASRNALVVGEPQVAAALLPLRLCAGQDFARNGMLMEWLVGMGIARPALVEARVLLARQVFDRDGLVTLARVLGRLAADRPSLGPCYERTALEVVRALASLDPAEADDVYGSHVGWRHLYSVKLWLADGLERLAAHYRRSAAIGRLPALEAEAAAERLLNELSEDVHALVKESTRIYPYIFQIRAEVEMHLHLLRVGVALAQHRAQHGSWPERLDELVPAYLPRIDNCPLSGAPLGYSKGKLWSIGGDWDDDGGRPLPEDADPDDDGDVVFDLNDRELPDPFEVYK